MTRSYVGLVFFVALALQAGCVTGRRTMDLPAAPESAPAAATRGHVYISAVTDDRRFENKPDDPSTPSIAGDVTTMTVAQKDQMIGRQRNSFGHAMGDIGLPPGDSMTKHMRALIEQGLRHNGYQVSSDPSAANTVAVSVTEFWAWTTPGFVALTFEAKVGCTLTIKSGDGASRSITVHGYGKNSGQVAKDANWREAYQPAFEDFEKNLGAELDKLGLRADR